MESVLVSIIIPTYNRADFLMKCLESILNQTYKNFEVLVIDDGSTDDTFKKVPGIDKRVLYYRLDKIGNLSFLRNYGLKNSKGEYVAFCDDDDLWLPEKLSVQIRYTNQYSIVCSNAILIEDNGKIRKDLYCSDFNSDCKLNAAHLFLYNYVITSSVLLRKKILPDIPFNSIRYKSTAEDYDLWLQLSLKYPIYFVNAPLIKYRMHSNLTYSWDNFPLIFLNGIDIINKYKRLAPRKLRKFALLGIYKLRKKYLKINISRQKFLISFRELTILLLNFLNPEFIILLLIYKINTHKKTVQNLENAYNYEMHNN